MFRNPYPYTDFHELNLDWLIGTTNKTKDDVDYLKEEFSKIEILSEEEIDEKISEAETRCNNYSDLKNDELHTQLEGEYKAYTDNEIINLKSYVNQQDTALKNYIDAQDESVLSSANGYTDERESATRTYIDNKIINVTYMFNPFRGYTTDVREVVSDIIDDYLKVNAISAGEYDALNLTAGDYDALNISAYNYDFDAKELLA